MPPLPIFAQVIVRGLLEPLTYSIPKTLEFSETGHEVQVEIRNRLERAWVIGTSHVLEEFASQKEKTETKESSQSSLFSNSEIQIKHKIKPILSSHQAFNPDDIPFFKWISDYYGAPLFEVFENGVPRLYQGRKPKVAFLIQGSSQDAIHELKKKANAQYETILLLRNNQGSLPLDSIMEEKHKRALKALEQKGLIEIRDMEEIPPEKMETKELTLNAEQKLATEKICEKLDLKSFSPFLLFGITGSGKTEVYIQAISHALAQGNNALLIVPEIALTPQIVGRFKDRLGVPVSILHSKVGASARWQDWEHVLKEEVNLTIGARSAIFAPIKNLALIIVDEEHESSYKQSDGLRYQARDLAIMKAKFHSCPVVLGSATPSFETLHNVSKGSYNLLQLKERASNAKLPHIKVVDMREIRKSEMRSENISPLLFDEMKSTLEKGEQIIIFYNKRGFASYLQCSTCGFVLSCHDCSVTMTYYQRKNKISCHYCGESKQAPQQCPRCHDKDIVLIEEEEGKAKVKKKFGTLSPCGSGTEKIYEEIQNLFPETKIARLDRESTGGKDSIEEILNSMHDKSSQILIGTQMIAKGHDLPNVTLVGFIDADVGLHFPDFRASERVFQLIVQAAGRAGRGDLPGKVIIQTKEPDHPTIVAATTDRFKAFARYELEYRKKLEYPPHARLARLVSSSTDREEAFESTKLLAHYLNHLKSNQDESLSEWKILGPSPAPIEKLRGRYRWHILLKSQSAKTLSRIAQHLHTWKHKQKSFKDFRLTIDIDPVDML